MQDRLAPLSVRSLVGTEVPWGHFVRFVFLRLVALLILCLFAGQALADNWNVTRLRGQVLQLVDGNWQPLERGGVIPDDRVVRTGPSGRLSLVRGKEMIELGPNTQIRIFDKGGSKPFTTVQQHFGTVAIEADVRNVQHFAVETPYLAAVVKGTHFTVVSGRSGAAVSVQRGHVAVEDQADHATTLVAAGQKASVQKGRTMTVSGKGQLPPVVKKGQARKPAAAAKTAAPQSAVAAKAAVAEAISDLKAAQAAGDPEAIELAKQNLNTAAQDAVDVAKDALQSGDKAEAKAAVDAAKAAEKAADEAAKAEAKADQDAAKDAKKVADDAAKAAEEARKAAEKAAKDLAKANSDADKAAIKAAEEAKKAAANAAAEARKAAEKAAKDQAKADEEAAKAAAKAEEEARKAAEKAAKEQAKADEEAAKAAAKAEEEALKAAEKAAKDAEKAAKSEEDSSKGKG